MFKFFAKVKNKLRTIEYNSLLIKYTFKLKALKKLDEKYPMKDTNYFKGLYQILNSDYSHNVDRLYLNDSQKTLLFEYAIASVSGKDNIKQDIENKFSTKNTKELRKTLKFILNELETDKKVKKHLRKSNIRLFSFATSVPLLFINVAKLPIFIGVFLMFPFLFILLSLLIYTGISIVSSFISSIRKDLKVAEKSNEIIMENSTGDFKIIKQNLLSVLMHTEFNDEEVKKELIEEISNMSEFEYNDDNRTKNGEDIQDIMKKLSSEIEKIEKNLNSSTETTKVDKSEETSHSYEDIKEVKLEKENIKEIIRERV